MYIVNAFSLQMLQSDSAVFIREVQHQDVLLFNRNFGLQSAIGHADTAAVVSGLLGLDLPANRVNVQLGKKDRCVVAQLMGGRLPEGSTTLPENMQIKFFCIETWPIEEVDVIG